MNFLFKYFDNEGRLKDVEKNLRSIRNETKFDAVLFDISNLAEAGMQFFAGIYPREAPYFYWGEGLELPWTKDYWRETGADEDSRSFSALPVGEEVIKICKELSRIPADGDVQRTYLLDYFSTPKLAVQGLAVELILELDVALELLDSGAFIEAILRINSANRFLFEMTIKAEDLLSSDGLAAVEHARALSRKGTDKRHAANRAVRLFAVEKFNSGSFPSANKASHSLVTEVLAHAESLGIRMSKERAQKTIYEWLLAEQKSR